MKRNPKEIASYIKGYFRKFSITQNFSLNFLWKAFYKKLSELSNRFNSSSK